MTNEPLSTRAARLWFDGFMLAGLGASLYAVVIIAAQCLGWIRSALWQPVPASLLVYSCEQRAALGVEAAPPVFSLLPCNATEYVYKASQLKGVDVILDFLAKGPLSVYVFALGIALMMWATSQLEEIEKRKRG